MPRQANSPSVSTLRQRTFSRMERIARLSQRGWKDVEIAAYLGVTPQTIGLDKKSPDYIAIELRVTQGVITELDEELSQGEFLRNKLKKTLVPAALEALADAVLDKRVALKTRLEAASEILDREGTFAKVSRVGISGDQQGGLITDSDENIADALASAVAAKCINQQAAKQASLNFNSSAGTANNGSSNSSSNTASNSSNSSNNKTSKIVQ